MAAYLNTNPCQHDFITLLSPDHRKEGINEYFILVFYKCFINGPHTYIYIYIYIYIFLTSKNSLVYFQ
jgi:hypothetical protein